MPWKTFLRAHRGAIAAADFFSVKVLTRGGVVRHLVLLVIDLKTRRVHIAGVTCRADAAWIAQVARSLTDAAAGPPGHICRRERLGGLLKSYVRKAA